MNNVEYAGFWRRFVATFIDIVIIYFLSEPLVILFSIILHSDLFDTLISITFLPFFIGPLLVGFPYSSLLWIKNNGQTIGSRLLIHNETIKVTKENGGLIDIKAAILRYWSAVLLYFIIPIAPVYIAGYLSLPVPSTSNLVVGIFMATSLISVALIIWHPKKQALHDLIAKTVVVKL